LVYGIVQCVESVFLGYFSKEIGKNSTIWGNYHQLMLKSFFGEKLVANDSTT
jgi:hypothetical protein